jgi:hypothetical protein
VTVALGWVEDARKAFQAHPGEMAALPAEHDMLAFKLDTVAGDLKQLRERMVRLLARANRVQSARHEDGPQRGGPVL